MSKKDYWLTNCDDLLHLVEDISLAIKNEKTNSTRKGKQAIKKQIDQFNLKLQMLIEDLAQMHSNPLTFNL